MCGLVASIVIGIAVVASPPRDGPAPTAPPRPASLEASVDGPDAQGIDVGDYQDSNGPIQWSVVAGQYQFAFVKATEGDYYVNQYYPADVNSALAAGLYVGEYTFATPDDASGSDEATYFLQQSSFPASKRLLVPMVDFEADPYGADICYGLDPSDMVSWISSYTATIYAALGVMPIIYTQASWWNYCTGGATAFATNPLWVGSDSTPSTMIPAGFASWAIWQSGVGSATGVTGPVDVDTFNGTVAQLASQLTYAATIQRPRDPVFGLCCQAPAPAAHRRSKAARRLG